MERTNWKQQLARKMHVAVLKPGHLGGEQCWERDSCLKYGWLSGACDPRKFAGTCPSIHSGRSQAMISLSKELRISAREVKCQYWYHTLRTSRPATNFFVALGVSGMLDEWIKWTKLKAEQGTRTVFR